MEDDGMTVEKLVTDSGLVAVPAAIGGWVGGLAAMPGAGVITGAFLGFCGVLARIGFEYWKIKHAEKQKGYRRKLLNAGIEPDTNP